MVKQTCLTFKRSSDSWADSVAGRQGRVGRIEIQVQSKLDRDTFWALYLFSVWRTILGVSVVYLDTDTCKKILFVVL